MPAQYLFLVMDHRELLFHFPARLRTINDGARLQRLLRLLTALILLLRLARGIHTLSSLALLALHSDVHLDRSRTRSCSELLGDEELSQLVPAARLRSEERRVGEGGRSGGARDG